MPSWSPSPNRDGHHLSASYALAPSTRSTMGRVVVAATVLGDRVIVDRC
jgi:hypothetical protein